MAQLVDADSAGFTKGILNSKQIKQSALYDDFKRFLDELVAEKKVNIEFGLEAKINDLEKIVKEVGLNKFAESVESIRPRLKQSILEDMDRRRKDIVDEIEMAMLSRELPDRLLLYRAIKQDTHVQAALDFIKAGRISQESQAKAQTAIASTSSTASSKSSSDKLLTYDEILHPQ
jgi:hypothetical protein